MVWSCWSMHDCRVNARNAMYVSSVCYCLFFWLSLFQGCSIHGSSLPLCFQEQEMDHLAQMVTTLKEGWEANGFYWNESINLEQHLLAFFGGLLGSKIPPSPAETVPVSQICPFVSLPAISYQASAPRCGLIFSHATTSKNVLQKSQDCSLTQCFWYDRVWTAVTN